MPGIEAPLNEAGAACVHAYRAGDFAMEMFEVNMPGTDREHPNRRRKLRLPVQTLFALGSAKAVLEEVGRNRETPSRIGKGSQDGQGTCKGRGAAVRRRHQGRPTQSRRQHQALTLSPEFRLDPTVLNRR
jgi:hypothetical protein